MSNGLRHSGIPLGGLGTGSVEIRNDGMFHEWQIMNNKPWGPGPGVNPPHNALFFGLQVHGDGEKRSIVLSTPPERDNLTNDAYGMAWLEHASSIESQTRYPFTNLDYKLDGLPVAVKL